MDHEKIAAELCEQALKILKARGLNFKPMRSRYSHVNTKHGFIVGRTSLKTGLVTIDIWTPKKRQPKSLAGILRTLCHEAAHHQKKPYRQRYRGRWIIRQHYPSFYKQVNKNIIKLKKSRELGKYFS